MTSFTTFAWEININTVEILTNIGYLIVKIGNNHLFNKNYKECMCENILTLVLKIRGKMDRPKLLLW